MFSHELTRAQKGRLVEQFLQGESYPIPAIAELGHQASGFEGLECWYVAPAAGGTLMELLSRIAKSPGFEAAQSGDYLAVNGPLPPKVIAQFGLLPVGDAARQDLGLWLEEHAPDLLGAAQMAQDTAAQEAEMAFQRHMDAMLGHIGLLNALMPHFGVHTPIQIFDSGATTLQVGQVTARLVASGWEVEPFSTDEPDLSLPPNPAFTWSDVLDAALEARQGDQQTAGAVDAYLTVINMAALIGTPAAIEFIASYSDMTSPAHEIALRELAKALGRESELDALDARKGNQ